jgi:26S proteasome regulatory subunit N2
VFAYPKKLEEKKEEKKKRVETVALSTTAKEKARQARKRAKGGEKGSAMEVDKEEEKTESKDSKEDEKGEKMDLDKEEEEKKPKKKREPEPTTFRVGNPSRITAAQSLVCEFDLGQRYRPIRPEEKPFGVIILTDSTPGEAEDLGAVKAPSLEPEGECAPPEPFEWTPPEDAGKDKASEGKEEK